MSYKFDFLVLGGGVAGLSFALQAAEHGTVAVLTKRARHEGNTHYAQGGIASVLSSSDSFEEHIQDTLVAGADLCHQDAVEVTVREGPERVKALVSMGAEFNRMRDDTAARTAYAVGSQFARAGKWAEAREVFALLAARYPGHPLAIDAFRWLLRYHAGSETRRRVEIQQKITFGSIVFQQDQPRRVVPVGASASPAAPAATEDVYRLYSPDMIVKWHQACLDFVEKNWTDLRPLSLRAG